MKAGLNARDYGYVGNGATSDSAALTALFATASAANKVAEIPSGTTYLSSSVTVPTGVVVHAPKLTVMSGVSAGPTLIFTSSATWMGRLQINCGNTGQIGVLFGGGTACEHASIEDLYVDSPTLCGVKFHAVNDTSGVYYNRISRLRVRFTQASGCAVWFKSDIAAAPWICNANRIEMATLQNNLGDALRVEGGDGNSFGYLECESNAGWAIDLRAGTSFFMDSGWIEGNAAGNIRIADYPAFQTVHIVTSCDTALDSSDAKFSHTNSTNRTVEILTGTGTHEYGRRKTGAQYVMGPAGQFANDLAGALVGQVQMAGGMELARLSAGSPYFYFRGISGAGIFFSTDGGSTSLLGLTSTAIRAYQNLLFATDNANDIGAAGATRPRNIYLAGNLVINGVNWLAGSGSPQSVVSAPIGSMYLRTDGGTGTTLYVKESGTGNTGWVAK